MHNRLIGEISSANVLQLLKGIEKCVRRETAKKMRSTLSAVFRLAFATQRADADPTAALKGALVPPKITGRAAITDERKFGALLRAFDEFTGWPVIIQVMTFQILPMTRSGQVRGACRAEFDLDKGVWTVRSDRTKMRREHKVPLSRQARKIVEDNWPTREDAKLLFPSLISHHNWLSENAFNSALRRMGYSKDEVTAHGFRVTARTIQNTRGYDPDVIEAALSHLNSRLGERAFQTGHLSDKLVTC